jgi:hypothetical protein
MGPKAEKRVQVLLSEDEAERFDAYCRDHGFKKSTLVARLIREHLDRERFPDQRPLFASLRPGDRGSVKS